MPLPTDRIRIGILGTGQIAHKMAQSLAHASICSLRAVGSRTAHSSLEFASAYENSPSSGGAGIHAWGSYQELVNDPEIDLIYIATPHHLHYSNCLMALAAGKHVLVEKPFALHASQTQNMIQLAYKRGLFLMEAMWTRFIPAIRQARELVRSNAIGSLVGIQANLGFNFPFDPEYRVFNPSLGGGSMLDLGIYPLSFASFFAGVPITHNSIASLTQTGVDASVAFSTEHSQGVIASLFCTVLAETDNQAALYGSSGTISVGPLFIDARQLTVKIHDRPTQTIDLPFPGPGYHFEADEAAYCIQHGLVECPDMPLAESLALSQIMDSILDKAGVHYQP